MDQSSRLTRPGGRLTAALVYGATAAATLAAPAVARRLGRKLPPAAADGATMASLIGGGWLALALTERARPFREDWNESQDDVGTDVRSLAAILAVAQVVGVGAAKIRRRLGGHTLARPMARLPLAARVGVAVLAYDLFHTLYHRTEHETALWRLHSVHHGAPRLYWLNATRFHPVEILGDVIGEQAILVALGLDGPTRLSVQVLRGIYGQIQHGNIDLDSGPLNQVLSTPERHRWHHSVDPAEGNTNYGAVVCVWDRLLGTAFLPEHRPFDAQIGVAG